MVEITSEITILMERLENGTQMGTWQWHLNLVLIYPSKQNIKMELEKLSQQFHAHNISPAMFD